MQPVNSKKDEVSWLIAFGEKYPFFVEESEILDAEEWLQAPQHVYFSRTFSAGEDILVIEGRKGSLVYEYVPRCGVYRLSLGVSPRRDEGSYQVLCPEIPANLTSLKGLLERL